MPKGKVFRVFCTACHFTDIEWTQREIAQSGTGHSIMTGHAVIFEMKDEAELNAEQTANHFDSPEYDYPTKESN